jgi:hypothetical protein
VKQIIDLDIPRGLHEALLAVAQHEGIPFSVLISRILAEWSLAKSITAAQWPPKMETRRAGGSGPNNRNPHSN